MSASKPSCPVFEELEIDQDALVSLRNLGVSIDIIKSANKEKLIYDAYVELWKINGKNGKVPTVTDVARKAGILHGSIYELIYKLVTSNKLIKIGRGIYVPRV
jgi:hypothetical protein